MTVSGQRYSGICTAFDLEIRLEGDRVVLGGRAVTVMRGTLL